MTEALFRKYRPQAFGDTIGQHMTAVVLAQMVSQQQVPSGLMFSGPSGTGKTTMARILASAMDADVIEIDAASTGGVEQVRTLLDTLRYASGKSSRVVILDEAHSITRQGFEALLKTLEEPPGGVHFVLVTTEPHKIPEVITSRLIDFAFRSVTAGAILDRLKLIAQREQLDVSGELLVHLAQGSGGNVRRAIQDLDKAARAGTATLEAYQELSGEHDSAPRLLAVMLTANHAQIFDVLDELLTTVADPAQVQAMLVSCLRDLFVLKAGGEPKVGGAGLQLRRELARRIEQERLMVAVRILWEVRTKIRASDDPRGNLELALILVAEALTKGKVAPPTPSAEPRQEPVEPTAKPVSSPPQERLTLADLQRS